MNKNLKWVGIIGMALSILALCFAYPLPSGQARMQQTPRAYQLLREHSGTDDMRIQTSLLESVLDEGQRQRQFFILSLKLAVFFNVFCLFLSFFIYRLATQDQKISRRVAGVKSSDAPKRI